MSLGAEQREFTADIARLISYAYAQGYELSFGDAYRDPRLHGMYGVKKAYGHKNSQHKRRLAVDFNLFKDGEYLDGSEDHAVLGAYWESLHPHNRWGGRFKDGNHYERVPGGW